MTNFEKYIQSLTIEEFVDSMILNCDGCPAFPCKADSIGTECAEELKSWCEEEISCCTDDACDIIFD